MLQAVPHTGLSEAHNASIRSEDIRFSPSGRLLAVVATSGSMFLFEVDTAARPIRVLRYMEIRSPGLAAPHGIDFLDERTVVVANRSAWLTFFRLPDPDAWQGTLTVDPIHEASSPWFGAKGSVRDCRGRMVSCGPGSVRVDRNQLYACCNNRSTVTRRTVRLKRGAVVTGDDGLVVREGLEIPDGLALSRDGRWLAVGEHETRRILVYRRGDAALRCTLRDPELTHPHGLCFDPTGGTLYVADAGQRGLHVFSSVDDWSTSMDASTACVPAVDPEAFHKTKDSVAEQYRPLEGGIKGLDVDKTGRLLATTCQHQMLRFFALDSVPTSASTEKAGRVAGLLRRLLGRS